MNKLSYWFYYFTVWIILLALVSCGSTSGDNNSTMLQSPTFSSSPTINFDSNREFSGLTQIGLIGYGALRQATWEPNTNTLYLNGTLGIWRKNLDDEIESLSFQEELGDSIHFSPNGTWVVNQTSRNNYLIRGTTSDEIIVNYQKDFTYLPIIRFDPQEEKVAFASFDGEVKVFDLNDGKIIQNHDIPRIRDILFDVSGNLIALQQSEDSSILTVLDIMRNETLEVISVPTQVNQAKLFFDASLYIAFSDRSSIFTIKQIGVESPLYTHDNIVLFSHVGSHIIAVGNSIPIQNEIDTILEQQIRIIDLEEMQVESTIFTTSIVHDAAFNPTTFELAVVKSTGLEIWNTLNNELVWESKDYVPYTIFSNVSDNKLLAGYLSTITSINLDTALILEATSTSFYFNSLALNQNGLLASSSGRDGVARIWNTENFNEVIELRGWQEVYQIEFSYYDPLRVIVSGGYAEGSNNRYFIRVWDLTQNELYIEDIFVSHIPDILITRPYSNQVAYGSRNSNFIRLMNIDTGIVEQSIQLDQGLFPLTFSFSANGDYISIVKSNNTIDVWDVGQNLVLANITIREGEISVSDIDSTGSYLVAAINGQIHLYGVKDKTRLEIVEVKNSFVNSVSFFDEDRKIISGSSDGTLRVWQYLER